MNPRLLQALRACSPLPVQTLEAFLSGLLDEAPEVLACKPGTPATVLAAQFTYYAKTSTLLAEVLRRERPQAQRLEDLTWRLQNAAPATERMNHGPDLPARKTA